MTSSSIEAAIAWCIAWGEKREPRYPLPVLRQMVEAIEHQQSTSDRAIDEIIEAVRSLQTIEFPQTSTDLKALVDRFPLWWNTQIGLVYGGATKIKSYVFEAAKLPDIRGASALLDRINLVDLPAFFGKVQSELVSAWLAQHFPGLQAALIPELIVYSTGGNILAFCPAAWANKLADAIERRYTEETLTANSCAVAAAFRPLETQLGLLRDPIEQTQWFDWYQQHRNHPIVTAYFGKPDPTHLQKQFRDRKSFNELVGQLSAQFQARRSGNDCDRPSHRYPPMFETHPGLVRDESDRRSAITQVKVLPDEPQFSDTLARKRIVGQLVKRQGSSQQWYRSNDFCWQTQQGETRWEPELGQPLPSWVTRFEQFLQKVDRAKDYYGNLSESEVQPARTLRNIGITSKGFVGYIYADGNNVGGYIQTIRTAQAYQSFSNDISIATEYAVYLALEKHLKPRHIEADLDSNFDQPAWIHPFEIVTIGGDDVLLIVPADKALEITQTIGELFEQILLKEITIYPEISIAGNYQKEAIANPQHRYQHLEYPVPVSHCQLSLSSGLLITAIETPIYYAEKLVSQLLKSAKQKAKSLPNYDGGTVDFLVMKAVTMLSSKIKEFREQGLVKVQNGQHLKLYATPYTLHELSGLIRTAEALKEAKFPRSQLYQIRSFLERGKRTAILNYNYFRVRLEQKAELEKEFDRAWCEAKTNPGNIAPWMYVSSADQPTYETIWCELVDLYPFVGEPSSLPELAEVDR